MRAAIEAHAWAGARHEAGGDPTATSIGEDEAAEERETAEELDGSRPEEEPGASGDDLERMLREMARVRARGRPLRTPERRAMAADAAMRMMSMFGVDSDDDGEDDEATAGAA